MIRWECIESIPGKSDVNFFPNESNLIFIPLGELSRLAGLARLIYEQAIREHPDVRLF